VIRIAVSQAAFDAIASTMPPGCVVFDARPTSGASALSGFRATCSKKLKAMRRQGERYSDVILALAEAHAGR
jgi:hypothetical protein